MNSLTHSFIRELLSANQYEQAIKACRKYIKKQGRDSEVLYLMGLASLAAGKHQQAIESYQAALAYRPNAQLAGKTHCQLGLCYEAAEDHELAELHFSRALKRDPDQVLAALKLAGLHAQCGNYDEAISNHEYVLAHGRLEDKVQHQLDQRALFLLSRIASYEWSEDKVKRILELLDDQRLTDDMGKIYCHFALGHIYEKRGEYNKALDHFIQANAIRKCERPYAIGQNQPYIDAVLSSFDSQYCQEHTLGLDGVLEHRPVFILGMPRSGSTLVERILGAHSSVTALDELPYLSECIVTLEQVFPELQPQFENLSNLKEEHFQHIRRTYLAAPEVTKVDSPVFTDKMPENFAYIGFLLMAMPEARVVHTVRHPLATLWSCFQNDFDHGQGWSYDRDALVDYYNGYVTLMHHWEQLFPGKIHSIRYESLVSDFEVEARKLIDFCGLGWEPQCMEFYKSKGRVKTASNVQVHSPVHRKAIDKWQNYKDFLLPLEKRLVSY